MGDLIWSSHPKGCHAPLITQDQLIMSKYKRDLELTKLLKIKGERCYLCGLEFTVDNPPTRDHIQPRADGGSRHSLGNISLAHGRCNRERDRVPIDFFRMRTMFLSKYPFAKQVKKRLLSFERTGQSCTKQKYWAD